MSKLDLAVVLDLIDKVSAPAKKIRGVTGHLNQSLDNTLESIKNLNRQQKQVKEFDKLNNKLKEQSLKLNDAQANFKRLLTQIKSTPNPTKKLRNELERANKQVKTLSLQQDTLRKKTGKAAKALKEQGIDTRNLTAAQKKLEQQLGKTEKRYQRYQKLLRVTNAGKQLAGKAAFAGAALGGSVLSSAGLLFAQLKAAADEADKIAKLSGNLKIDSATLQAARYQGELNGVSSNDIDQALTRFSKRMGRLKASSGAIYGLLNKTDKAFANTLKNAGSNDQAFALMTEYIANIKDAQKQSALADAAFGQTGRNMLIMLRQGKQGIIDARKEFSRFGGGADNAFMTNAERFNDALFRIGILIKSVKFKVLAPVLEKITAKLEAFLKQFSNSNNAQKFINEIVTKAKRLIAVLEEIYTAATAFFSLMSRIKEFVGGWQNLAIIITSIKLLPLVSSVGSLIGLFAALSAPVGIAVAAVGALIAAGVLLYKNWDKVTSWFNGVLDAIAKKFSWIGNLWNSIFGGKKTAHAEINQTVKQASNNVIPFRTPVKPKIINSRHSRRLQNSQQNNVVQITVNPSPGMDEKQLASIVKQQLEHAQNAQQSRARANLYDFP